jgi:hypothetical protein
LTALRTDDLCGLMSERLPKSFVGESLRGRLVNAGGQVVMKGPGCRPGEQPKNPADKSPAGWARTLASFGERGVRTVATWFFTGGAATGVAAVSYTERMVVLWRNGDGDPEEDTIPCPRLWGLTARSPARAFHPLTWPGRSAAGQAGAWEFTWPQPLGNDAVVGRRAPGPVFPGVRALTECSSVV